MASTGDESAGAGNVDTDDVDADDVDTDVVDTDDVDADDEDTDVVDTDDVDADDAEAVKARAMTAADGDPECVLCSSAADYFLFEAGRVEQFVCWEHVSPHSAAVDGDPEETPAGRPVALEL